MNKEFERLTELAGIVIDRGVMDCRHDNTAQVHKFADLVIRECLQLVSSKEIAKDVTEYEQGYNRALKTVYSDIIAKFGVTE